MKKIPGVSNYKQLFSHPTILSNQSTSFHFLNYDRKSRYYNVASIHDLVKEKLLYISHKKDGKNVPCQECKQHFFYTHQKTFLCTTQLQNTI